MTDELERRLRAADPAPEAVPVDSARSPRARALVERTMADQPLTLDHPAAPTTRRWWPAVAAAAAAVAVVAGVVAVAGGGGSTPTSLALDVPAEDLMAMCIQITPEILADGAEVAFEGTVESVEGSTATLSVDRWFTGEEVDEVVLTVPDPSQTALLGGPELEPGGHYLISAAGGEVRSCGLSGPVSPELTALFEQAFEG